MSSGHSHSVAFYLLFIYYHFRNYPLIFYSSPLYSIYLPYTRIKFGYHTYQQVIIGFISSLIFFYIYIIIFINILKINILIKTIHEGNPPNRNRTSDQLITIVYQHLQSIALPTELSEVP